MQALPHHYSVSLTGTNVSAFISSADDLPDIITDAPPQFDGPGDQWSPESLLTAAVASCFALSFRAITKASRFSWQSLSVNVTTELDRIDKITRFTKVKLIATLEIDATIDEEKAERLLHKAEQSCLVSNSLLAERQLECKVIVVS